MQWHDITITVDVALFESWEGGEALAAPLRIYGMQ
jgi:hypothetical protein